MAMWLHISAKNKTNVLQEGLHADSQGGAGFTKHGWQSEPHSPNTNVMCKRWDTLRLIWKSVATFMEKLYENSDFSGNRPFLINRHWILHGRDATAWTVADSIRLFNALQTIV